MAFVDAMYPGEKPFLIMDDAKKFYERNASNMEADYYTLYKD